MTIAAQLPGVPGAEVREVASLPEALDGAVRVGGYSMARPGALLQTVPEVARFLITGGNLIELVREEGADPMAVEQFLSGSARAALVHQRGGLPLHAACLTPPDGEFAVAITGHSGAGKSTLAAELVRQGWSLLGDDVTPLYGAPGPVMAWPSRDGIKLWRDACERFTIDADELLALPGERDKYLLPVHTQAGPVRLGYIFVLDRRGAEGVIPIEGPARLATLTVNTYKPHYLTGLGCVQSHFRISCQISAEVNMGILRWNGPAEGAARLLLAYCTNRLEESMHLSQTSVSDSTGGLRHEERVR
jgi:hypothetical protein